MEPLSLHEFLNYKFVYPKSVIGSGVLFELERMFMYGKYKSFKSMLALSLGMSVICGEHWLGFNTEPAPVLYLQSEVSAVLLQERVDKMHKSWAERGLNIADAPECPGCNKRHYPLVFWTEPYLKLDTDLGQAKLEGTLATIKPKLLIIDPLFKVMSGDMLDPNATRDFLDMLDIVRERHKLAIVMVAHSSKREIDSTTWGGDDMMGSIILNAWADTILRVTRMKGGARDEVAVDFELLRNAPKAIDQVKAMLDAETLEFKTKVNVLPENMLSKEKE